MTDVLPMQQFRVVDANEGVLQRIAALAPANPFRTPAFAEAHRQLGLEVRAVLLGENESIQSGTIALVREGRVGRILTIPSALAVPPESPFWAGVDHYATREAVTELQLQSFGSPAMPPLRRNERARIAREEYVLDLGAQDLLSTFTAGHRRWIRDAARAGLILRRTTRGAAIDGALAAHAALADRASAHADYDGELDRAAMHRAALVAAGAADVYQALQHTTTVASIIVLRSAAGAYLMTSEVSDAGQSYGALHWLIYETAYALAEQGVDAFNLGGVRQSQHEERAFREGFQPTVSTAQSVTVRCGRRWQWAALNTADRVRRYFRARGD